jgi:hypothetical protein
MVLGLQTPQGFVPPAWLVFALIEVAAGVILLFFGHRRFNRIEAAWRNSIQHYEEASTQKARV